MNAVSETPNCVNGSTSQENSRRLSGLAWAIRLFAEKGITSAAQLAEITGYSERAIWKAKAELRCTTAPECTLNPGAVPPEPQFSPPLKPGAVAPEAGCSPEARAHARIDSPFGRDSFSEESPKTIKVGASGEVGADAPEKFVAGMVVRDPGKEVRGGVAGGAAVAKTYRFNGQVIRLTEADYARWKQVYFFIDLDEELERVDAYYAEHPEKCDRRLFHRVSAWLCRENDKRRQEDWNTYAGVDWDGKEAWRERHRRAPRPPAQPRVWGLQ